MEQITNKSMSVETGTYSPETIELPRGFIHFYVYDCVASTETRGSGQIKGKKQVKTSTPCGWANLRKMKLSIEESHDPQGVKCKHCGNRPRLNPGMVSFSNAFLKENRPLSNHDRTRIIGMHQVETSVADVITRKAWAENEMNRRNRIWLSKHSNAIEQNQKTIEDSLESFEQGGVLIE